MTDVFRRNPAQLTEQDKELIEAFKAKADELYSYLCPNYALSPGGAPAVVFDPELMMARAKLEECVMWAVKGFTAKYYE